MFWQIVQFDVRAVLTVYGEAVVLEAVPVRGTEHLHLATGADVCLQQGLFYLGLGSSAVHGPLAGKCLCQPVCAQLCVLCATLWACLLHRHGVVTGGYVMYAQGGTRMLQR